MKKLMIAGVCASLIFGIYSCKKDTEPPVITILGDNPISVCIDFEYTDAGASAHDNEDGDVTSKIEISSNVNISAIGTYHVTYTVKDEAGNQALEQREVNVIYCK
jgi:hypothetical protein